MSSESREIIILVDLCRRYIGDFEEARSKKACHSRISRLELIQSINILYVFNEGWKESVWRRKKLLKAELASLNALGVVDKVLVCEWSESKFRSILAQTWKKTLQDLPNIMPILKNTLAKVRTPRIRSFGSKGAHTPLKSSLCAMDVVNEKLIFPEPLIQTRKYWYIHLSKCIWKQSKSFREELKHQRKQYWIERCGQRENRFCPENRRKVTFYFFIAKRPNPKADALL